MLRLFSSTSCSRLLHVAAMMLSGVLSSWATLALVDPRMMTTLVRDGRACAEGGAGHGVVAEVPADVWDGAFALGPDDALVVRPDQHIAARRRG